MKKLGLREATLVQGHKANKKAEFKIFPVWA